MASLPSLLLSIKATAGAARRAACVIATLVLTACATDPTERDQAAKPRLEARSDAFAVNKGTLCFTYLEDPKSRDRKNWDDLLTQDDKIKKAKNVVKFLLPKDGYGDYMNMDYFALTFEAPPNVTVEAFFAQMRKDFNVFAAWDGGYNVFGAYGPNVRNISQPDPDREENEKKWAQADHTGALMTFLLAGMGFSTHPTSNLGSQFLVVKQYGDVQSTCSSSTDFIFTTVKTDTDTHPVSGRRGFGLKEDSGKRTWTFYSKAVDRRSNTAMNIAHEFGAPAPDVYVEGRKFWSGFYAKMVEYLKEKKIKVPAGVSENCNLAKWNDPEFRKCDPL